MTPDGGRTQVVLAGSLGKGNVGDHALLASFLRRHGGDFDHRTVLAEGPVPDGGRPVQVLPPPPYALGRRFWRGARTRRRVAARIQELEPSARRTFVWLGGLFGPHEEHNRLRYHELRWARQFCPEVGVYFGDAADGFETAATAPKLVALLDEGRAWVGVRSAEAAGVLRAAGLRAPVHVGIDPVLFDLAVDRALPFARRHEAVERVAIVPSVYRAGEYRAAWLAAAHAAHARGFAISWISMSDPEDLALCEELGAALLRDAPRAMTRAVPSEGAVDEIERSSACVATRYHAAIFALTAGVPALGVPYDVKIDRLFGLLEIQDFLWGARPLAEQLDRLLAGGQAPSSRALQTAVERHHAALRSFAAGCTPAVRP